MARPRPSRSLTLSRIAKPVANCVEARLYQASGKRCPGGGERRETGTLAETPEEEGDDAFDDSDAQQTGTAVLLKQGSASAAVGESARVRTRRLCTALQRGGTKRLLRCQPYTGRRACPTVPASELLDDLGDLEGLEPRLCQIPVRLSRWAVRFEGTTHGRLCAARRGQDFKGALWSLY